MTQEKDAERATTHQGPAPRLSTPAVGAGLLLIEVTQRLEKAQPLILAERLKVETRPLHVDVKRSAVIVALLDGLDRHAYLALLQNLQAISTRRSSRRFSAPCSASRGAVRSGRAGARRCAVADIAELDDGAAEAAGRSPLEAAPIDCVYRLAYLGRCAPELPVAAAMCTNSAI
jgi:hypothetical protein